MKIVISSPVQFVVLLVACFSFFASSAEAYYTTNQSAVTVGDTKEYAVFIVDYTFGSAQYDFVMPAVAKRGDGTDETFALSYNIVNRFDEVVDDGVAMGAILSNVSLQDDGTYVVPQGQRASFKLLVLLHVPAPASPEKYRLQVTGLPFDGLADEELKKFSLNPSELEVYHTPQVALNN